MPIWLKGQMAQNTNSDEEILANKCLALQIVHNNQIFATEVHVLFSEINGRVEHIYSPSISPLLRPRRHNEVSFVS